MSWFTDSIKEFFHKGDLLLLSLCLAASGFGLVLIYSATRYMGVAGNRSVLVQLVAIFLGILVYMFLSAVDIELVTGKSWRLLVVFNVLFVLALIPFGLNIGGNKSWIDVPLIPVNIQPAEIVKLSFVMLLAKQMTALQERDISRPSSLAQFGGHTLAMCALIFLCSGDMGMVVVYAFIFVVMTWAAGLKLRWFAIGTAAAAGLGALAWPHIPNYMKMRFMVVFDHALDPLTVGFHQARSLLAIGSGQVMGQGFMKGTQTQSAYSSALPERHTDFIFAVCGEELGLIGCLAVILLLSAIILRCIWVSRRAPSGQSALIALGFAGMLMIQTVMNIGMCLFVAPVVGLTLPFLSYGGSSIVTLFAAMGIVSSIKMRSLPSWLRDRSRI